MPWHSFNVVGSKFLHWKTKANEKYVNNPQKIAIKCTLVRQEKPIAEEFTQA